MTNLISLRDYINDYMGQELYRVGRYGVRFLVCLLLMFAGHSKTVTAQVSFAGTQTKIRNGDFSAAVLLDTLPKEHLFALGPEEGLRSELFVWNGRIFRAGVWRENGQPYVEKDAKGMQAVFLVWANVPAWDTVVLQENIVSLRQLEQIIGMNAHRHGLDTSKAFPFLLLGKFLKAQGHIMDNDTSRNLITAATGGEAKKYFPVDGQRVQLLGFYSHHHRGIFTHHDSFTHIHYRTYSKHHAGHLDEASFDPSEPLRLLLAKKATF